MSIEGGIRGGPWKGRAQNRKRYPGAFPLSESQLNLIEELAKNAPLNPNQLKKITKKAYSFVYNTLKEAERRKILSLRLEKNQKGTNSRMYDLDLEGVLLVLRRWSRNPELSMRNKHQIFKTIERYGPKLPLVFGKWKYFTDAGLGEIVWARLWLLLGTHASNPFRRGTGYYWWLEMEPQMTRFFFLWDFYRGDDNPITGFDFKTWMTVIKNDAEIRAFVTQELEHERKTLNGQQALVEKILSFVSSS